MESFVYGSLKNFKKIGSYRFYLQYRKKYGETFVVWFGMEPRIYTSNADYIKKVSQNLNSYFIKKYLRPCKKYTGFMYCYLMN